MLYTLQIILYSFIIIYICHNLYLFFNENFIENTYHDLPLSHQNEKTELFQNYDSDNDTKNNSNQNSQSMKNELQNFLNTQVKTEINNRKSEMLENLNQGTIATNQVGTTSIEDIPITA